jgi:hypothetical protein
MASSLTTGLKTLSQCLIQSTPGIMRQAILGSEVRQTERKLLRLERKPLSGIGQTKAVSGTSGTESGHGLNESRMLSAVSSAAESMRRGSRYAVSFVRRHAKPVRVESVQRLQGLKPVYDITVDGHHCYIANGMLVSNSDALRTGATGFAHHALVREADLYPEVA